MIYSCGPADILRIYLSHLILLRLLVGNSKVVLLLIIMFLGFDIDSLPDVHSFIHAALLLWLLNFTLTRRSKIYFPGVLCWTWRSWAHQSLFFSLLFLNSLLMLLKRRFEFIHNIELPEFQDIGCGFRWLSKILVWHFLRVYYLFEEVRFFLDFRNGVLDCDCVLLNLVFCSTPCSGCEQKLRVFILLYIS